MFKAKPKEATKCDQIRENPPNRQLFKNKIEARIVDAIITVV